jgi:hypothetical protein
MCWNRWKSNSIKSVLQIHGKIQGVYFAYLILNKFEIIKKIKFETPKPCFQN